MPHPKPGPHHPTPLRTHGLSTRRLNILFGCLFGFPALMGLVLAIQSHGSSTLGSFDKPLLFPASVERELPQPLEKMLNPPWDPPPDVRDFGKETLVEERFADLTENRQVALLDLPGKATDQETAGVESINPSLAYGNFAKEMNLLAPESGSFTWNVPAVPGETLNGRAQVVDAGVLVVGPSRVRLSGLAFPEEGRMCSLLSGEKRDCRQIATEQLNFYLRWRMVHCSVEGPGPGTEPLAQCSVGESDIGEWLVRRGWAVPESAAMQRYRAAALFAQSYQLGQYRP